MEKKAAHDAAKVKLDLMKEQIEIQKKSLTNTVGQVSLAETLDQTLTGTIPVLSQAELIAAHDVYEVLMEGPCLKDERPSDHQITAVFFMLGTDLNVFADLAIFGPHHIRIQRKLALSGLIPVAGGGFRRIEFKGPPDVGVWTVSFTVFRNTLLMGKAVGLSPMERYVKKIHGYVQKYGTKVWHLLYQADVRMRLEELPTIRRELVKEAEAVRKGGGTHPYDDSRPWHHVWQRATSERSDKFWTDEFEDPARMVRLELVRMGEVVDGDAPIGNPAGSSSSLAAPPTVQAPVTHTPPVPKRGMDDSGDGAWSWPLRVNKKRKSLCPGFQDGCCRGHVGSVICPKDSASRHQCAICLSHEHGAAACDGSGVERKPVKEGGGRGVKGERNKGAGKGGGRGNRGGKNGGRGQQGQNQWWNGNW